MFLRIEFRGIRRKWNQLDGLGICIF
jgi:hypothetical protein